MRRKEEALLTLSEAVATVGALLLLPCLLLVALHSVASSQSPLLPGVLVAAAAPLSSLSSLFTKAGTPIIWPAWQAWTSNHPGAAPPQ